MKPLFQADVSACCVCNRVRLGAVDSFSVQPEILAIQGERVSHTYCPDCAERELGIKRSDYVSLHDLQPVSPQGPTALAALITKCRHIAHERHYGEERIGGGPYVTHVEEVAARVIDRLKPIALLHDTVEHGRLSLDHLRALHLPEYVVNGVDSMTRRPKEVYADYIRRLKANPDAVAVKVVDIRLNYATHPNDSMRRRYDAALAILEGAEPSLPGA